jgi:hypothetical protein
MRNDHVTLRSTAVFDLLAPRTPAVPVQVELRYDTKDPYAVVAAFRTGRAGWVEWVFARDLLADGLIADAGDGDVRIRPAADDPEVVVIELSSPSGHAMFEASAQELADFLDRTYDVVVPAEPEADRKTRRRRLPTECRKAEDAGPDPGEAGTRMRWRKLSRENARPKARYGSKRPPGPGRPGTGGGEEPAAATRICGEARNLQIAS